MNFTLSLIYPAPNEQGIKNISVSELVCVVNADQTCSAAFFDNLLRFLDSGAFLEILHGMILRGMFHLPRVEILHGIAVVMLTGARSAPRLAAGSWHALQLKAVMSYRHMCTMNAVATHA
jgi:hypothetical protein